MALKAVISPEEFQTLGELLQRQYVPRDDRYYLCVLPATFRDQDGRQRMLALEDVADLKLALGKERTTIGELTERLKAFEGIDDPQAARQALAQVQEWTKTGPSQKTEKQMEAIKQQLECQYRNRIEALTRRVAAARQENEQLAATAQRLRIEGAATAALTRLGVLPEAHGAMVEQIHRMCRCRRVEAGGKSQWRIEVLDGHGNVRISNTTGSLEPMNMEELVGEMKAGSYAFAFQGQQPQGSNRCNGRAQSESLGLSPVERLKFARRASVETN